MKLNDTLNNLFNVAFGTATLDRAVFQSTTPVTRTEAMVALVAGYLAADMKGFAMRKPQVDTLIDSAAAILDMTRTNRSKEQQALVMRAAAKYLYYFGNGKSSKAGKATTSKSKPQIDPWALVIAEFLSQHPRKLAAIAAELGIGKPE